MPDFTRPDPIERVFHLIAAGRLQDSPASAKLVLLYLAHNSARDGEVIQRAANSGAIMQHCDVSRGSVTRTLAWLSEHGLIQVEYHGQTIASIRLTAQQPTRPDWRTH